MARSLGNCVRCARQHPATTTQKIAFGDSTYELRLCEAQADNLLRDMISWGRCGTIVETDDAATFKPKAEPVRRERGGVVVASHVHVPNATLRPVEQEQPATTVPIQRKPRFDTSLPINHDRWVWTDHAIQRARLRHLSSEEVLWCAEHPDTVRPGDGDSVIHIRGHVKVALDPATYEIIMVADRRYPDDEERDLQDAS